MRPDLLHSKDIRMASNADEIVLTSCFYAKPQLFSGSVYTTRFRIDFYSLIVKSHYAIAEIDFYLTNLDSNSCAAVAKYLFVFLNKF